MAYDKAGSPVLNNVPPAPKKTLPEDVPPEKPSPDNMPPPHESDDRISDDGT